ncbi:glycoside hydrolase N-terminal domain-containing protein [Paenibacillus yanchengensis]|uniref:Glycoside hydrolase N-terminal domain-containing protein n=1 Tax=Paenibacillus yanchengensis TaxID=2035833 RepID=A0ABW4YI48_9BACL
MKQTETLQLWYRNAAEKFDEALPIGNGRIGGMVYGGIEQERIKLNEDTLWSGGPKNTNNSEALAHLPEVRQLIADKQFVAAEQVITSTMLGPFTQSYMPLGDLLIATDHAASDVQNYRRTLDLEQAIATVSYERAGAQYSRQVFCSHPDLVMAIRLETTAPDGQSVNITMDSLLPYEIQTLDNKMLLSGTAPSHVDPNYFNQAGREPVIFTEGEGMRFASIVEVQFADGTVTTQADGLHISNAKEIVLLLHAATSFVSYDVDPATSNRNPINICEQTLRQVVTSMQWNNLLERHVADHRELFGRVQFTLDSPVRQKPTDLRLIDMKLGEQDLYMETLLFQYGRYLMIAGSRPGTEPLHLQGIWNESLRPPWSSNYTININTEMNYWPAEVCNLAECHEPLFDLIADLSKMGSVTAQEHYGASGWVAHHNTDLWRQTTPVGRTGEMPDTVSWAMWPMGGAWLVRHLWEHYEFQPSRIFLRETVVPIVTEAAQFLLDWLFEHESGYLYTSPSTTPENKFFTATGDISGVSEMTTMDIAIIRDVFTICLQANEQLVKHDNGNDKPFHSAVHVDSAQQLDSLIENIRQAIVKLPPYQIGANGQLQEWIEDYEEAEPGHRHVSHLYALHPGYDITPRSNPALAEACKTTLQRRVEHGGAHTGWSCAWTINMWARLYDGEEAYRYVRMLFEQSTNDNLFNSHPPFQIDGNFGYTAGVAEMLVQSHDGIITVLPAIPTSWASGQVKGLRARGGYEVAIQWSAEKIDTVEISASVDGVCKVAAKDRLQLMDDLPCQETQLVDGYYQYEFAVQRGKQYHLRVK